MGGTMDREPGSSKREDGGGGQSTNALLLLVTLLAGALLVRQIPLSDSRPDNAEPKAYESSAPAGVDARLWQDPMGAVARGIKEAGLRPSDAENPALAIAPGDAKDAGSKPTGPETAYSASAMAHRVQTWAQANAKQNPIIVGAMVPGGAYPGYAEGRRRARFAVVAGLKEMGFTPNDSEHLNFFFLDGPLRTQMLGSDKKSEGVSRRSPRGQFFAYEWFDFAPKGALVRSNATGDADPGNQRLLLIWLDQDFFWEQPLDQLSKFFKFLLNHPGKGDKANKDTPIIILGPGDSTVLRRMATEARSESSQTAKANGHTLVIAPGPDASTVVRRVATSAASSSNSAPPIKFRFYDYGATAPDAQLLPAPKDHVEPKSVNAFFEQTPATVFRTIGDDAMLACALRNELNLRGVRAPSPDDKDISPEVILISELDTEYGRAISETTKSALVGARSCPPSDALPAAPAMQYAEPLSSHWIKTYSYLRGVDGRLPQRQYENNGAGNTTKNASEGHKGSSPASDEKRIERAEGQSQLDYLRRLAAQLHAMDQRARAQGKPGIRAVGVLGSDVYDKLVVLQALRPTLPSAVFFTTDLDARLLHPNELGWTRNLIVASSYGLDLSPALQAGNPPFRDVYQTSLYLSTLIALTNAEREECWSREVACPVGRERIDDWRGQPRLFEIGLRGPVDLSDRREVDPKCVAVSGLPDCETVHPRSPGLAPEPQPLLWQLLFVAITIGLLIYLLANGAVERIRNWVSDPPLGAAVGLHISRRTVLIATAVTSLAALIGIWIFLPAIVNGVVGFVTQHGSGEPISLLDGISILGTELIRLIALILAIWMIGHSWRNLERNGELVAQEMKWDRSRKALNDDVDKEYAEWTWWQRTLHAFSFRLIRKNGKKRNETEMDECKACARTDPETGLRPEGEHFWRQYIYQGRIGARLLRVSLAIIVYLQFSILVAMVFGFPDNPIRGDLIKRFDLCLVWAVVLAMQFLVFFVIDATLLCRQFVMAVSRRDDEPSQCAAAEFDVVGTTTRWPDNTTLEHFRKQLNIDKRYADQWVTIHVIGLRTKAVSKLIYFPYIIISLAIVARSTVFDNWGMPLTLIIILGTSALIVTVSAILLRWAAEYARRKATWRLGIELIRLNGTNDPADQHVAKQIELLIAQINRYNTGSFASYLDQPFVRAFLLPLGSVGGVGALQYLTIWHF